MNYRDTSNHKISSLFNYTTSIVWQICPATFVFGFFSLTPSLAMKEVFLSGIIEFIATFSLSFSLALSVFFGGLTLIFKSRNTFLVNLFQRLTGYWSSFSVSLSATTLGIIAGLFFPFMYSNGFLASIAFLCLGLLVGITYGFLAHHSAILAFTVNIESLEQYKFWFGLAFSLLGIALGVASIETQWSKINGF